MTGPRVLVVAQSFKESLSCGAVASALERAVRRAGGNPQVLLGSDGGDGLMEALDSQLIRRTSYNVLDLLHRPVRVPVGWLDERSALVESRLACGLGGLQPNERDPLATSTRGVGQLIQCAIADGADRVIVGLGGSATMDGGIGMARTWGWLPLDESGTALPEGGGPLSRLRRLARGRFPQAELVGLCDVANPLLGSRGARTYARQKGATAEAEQQLAAGLERLAACMPTGDELALTPGAGAAGGMGFGLLAFAAAELTPGAAWVLERANVAAALAGAVLVVVGEGSFDHTSLEGKLTGVVLSHARQAGVPSVLVAPRAVGVPDGVTVATGGAWWDAPELEQRATRAIERTLQLL